MCNKGTGLLRLLPETPNPLGVWGSSASDVFAVGTGGMILHYPEYMEEEAAPAEE